MKRHCPSSGSGVETRGLHSAVPAPCDCDGDYPSVDSVLLNEPFPVIAVEIDTFCTRSFSVSFA